MPLVDFARGDRLDFHGLPEPQLDFKRRSIVWARGLSQRVIPPKLSSRGRRTMREQRVVEYCLIVEGAYATLGEAEHALRDPFIEDWVERTGRFRIHQMNSIPVAPGVMLGQLGIEPVDDGSFMITSLDANHPLTERKARALAEALRRQDMFDQIEVEPL